MPKPLESSWVLPLLHTQHPFHQEILWLFLQITSRIQLRLILAMLLPGSQPLHLSLGVIAIAPLLVSCSYTYCLLSVLNTGAARVTPIKLVRSCYKPTQNPAMIPHLSKNKSQYPDSGSLVLINTVTSALPFVYSISVSLASLFHRKCIWLRTLIGTDCFFCLQNTSPENC